MPSFHPIHEGLTVTLMLFLGPLGLAGQIFKLVDDGDPSVGLYGLGHDLMELPFGFILIRAEALPFPAGCSRCTPRDPHSTKGFGGLAMMLLPC